MRKVTIVSLFLLVTGLIYAQEPNESLLENGLMASWFMNKQYSVCAFYAENIIATNNGNFSESDVFSILIGAQAYEAINESEKAKHLFRIADENLEQILPKNQFLSKEDNPQELKVELSGFINRFSKLLLGYGSLLLSVRNSNIMSESLKAFEFFHQTIYYNRALFQTDTIEDAFELILMYQIEWVYAVLIWEYDRAFTEMIPEILALARKFDRKDFNIRLLPFFETIEKSCAVYILSDKGKQFTSDFTNLLIKRDVLRSQLDGKRTSQKWFSENVNWHEISSSLKENERAVLVFAGIESDVLKGYNMDIYGSVIISPYPVTPTIRVFGARNENELLELLKRNIEDCSNLFFATPSSWAQKDFIYTQSDVHQLYSLYDIVRRDNIQERAIKDKKVILFSNIDYGKGDDGKAIPELEMGKELIHYFEELFNERLYCLQEQNVRRINFMNVNSDVGIFHISTHGIEMQSSLPVDVMSLAKDLLGNNSMENARLALSGYNNDPHSNTISALDICKQDYRGVDLVFLDACETARTYSSPIGEYSLARAFYVAGAKNVIAYITPVNENIAFDFAKEFYLLLSSSSDIHSSFYIAKKRTVEKYKNDLPLNDIGNPDFGVVLWEGGIERTGEEKDYGQYLRLSSPNDIRNRHEWVDLGLSVKWATCNVGAQEPSDRGDLFAWGEINSKVLYEKSNWKWNDFHQTNKYSNRSGEIEMIDDVANYQWGAGWRVPTLDEIHELFQMCTWKWKTICGIKGYLVTSKINGKSIFLPTTGWQEGKKKHFKRQTGYYWSSSYNGEEHATLYVSSLIFTNNSIIPSLYPCALYGELGFAVRPVIK